MITKAFMFKDSFLVACFKSSIPALFKLLVVVGMLLSANLMAQESQNETEITAIISLYQKAVNENQYEAAGNYAEDIAKKYIVQKDSKKAISYYLKSLENHKKTDNFTAIVLIDRSLGNVYRKSGDYNAAIKFYSEGLELVNNYKELAPKIYTDLNYKILIDLSRAYKAQAKFQEEIKTLEEAVQIASQLGIRSLYNCYKSLNLACKAINCDQSTVYQDNYEKYQRMMFSQKEEVLTTVIKESTKKLDYAKTMIETAKVTIDSLQYINAMNELEQLQKENKEREQQRAGAEKASKLQKKNADAIKIIILSIIGFFIFLIFLPKKNILPQIVSKLFIFLSVILLIEFILVLVEPKVEEFADNAILYKYLINILLALVLFPLDNYLVNVFMKRVRQEKDKKD